MPQEKMTQAQIDELLNSIKDPKPDPLERGGERQALSASGKKAKVYDFKNPKTFSKDQIRIFSLVFENYVKHLSTYLSGLLRTDCTVSVESIEEQKYYEFNNALPESVMMGVIDVKPIEGSFLIDIQKQITYTIIDRLLGGTGTDVLQQNSYSDIELRLLEKFFRQIIIFLKEAWANVVDIEPLFNRIETNSRFAQVMPLDEVVVIVLLKVEILSNTGTISVCVPCINLDSILADKSSVIYHRKKKRADDDEKEIIFRNLKDTHILLHGILGHSSLSVGELMNMRVGDVIVLNKPYDTPAVVKIGNREWYSGEIGTRKNRFAIKIKSVL